MGGMTLGKSPEQMMREREAINAARRAEKMKSIRDVGDVTETGTPEEEFAPAYRTPITTKAFKRGGVTRADGCIKKGHTKGKMR